MASGKWLLLLLFCCCPERLEAADDPANHTVQDDVVETMDINLFYCSWVLEKYNNSLPNNNTDFDALTTIATIVGQEKNAACYYVLFDNSSVMYENRSAQANETGEALHLGWELSKQIPVTYTVSNKKRAANGVFLNTNTSSLDAYLTSVYDGLLAAIFEASGKLRAGEAPEQYNGVCTLANFTVMSCEIQRIGGMFGENCSNPKFVLPPQCSDSAYLDWPVRPYINIWKPSCEWSTILGEFNNLRRLEKFSRLVSSRLLHLVTALAICGRTRQDNVLSEALLKSIYAAGVEARDRAITAEATQQIAEFYCASCEKDARSRFVYKVDPEDKGALIERRFCSKAQQHGNGQYKRYGFHALNGIIDETKCYCPQEEECPDKSIQCDRCKHWIHGECANLTIEAMARIDKYYCQPCRDRDLDLAVTLKVPKASRGGARPVTSSNVVATTKRASKKTQEKRMKMSAIQERVPSEMVAPGKEKRRCFPTAVRGDGALRLRDLERQIDLREKAIIQLLLSAKPLSETEPARGDVAANIHQLEQRVQALDSVIADMTPERASTSKRG